MKPHVRTRWSRALIAAPALAFALAACGGADTEVATSDAAAAEAPVEQAPAAAAPSEPAAEDSASAPAEPTEAAAAQPQSSASPAESTAPAEAADDEPAPADEPAAATVSGRPPIEKLSADLAIAQADVNIANLAPAESGTSVLDIEVLAVGDGSIQTLRDVVVGDRPVLLWFFSPH